MGLLSIIIPIYNVEHYLRRALESVLAQSYKDLEILCVESESPDKCGAILEEYAQKDNRIKVFHKLNEGVSSSRNYCLARANGEYVTFLDPDDWVEPNTYEIMIEAMESEKADIAVCGFSKEWDNKRTVVENIPLGSNVITDYNEIMLHIFHRTVYPGFAGYIWNKVYRKNIISNIYFDESISMAEDVSFNVEVAENARRTIIIRDALYHYYQRPNSLFHSADIEKKEKILDVYENMIARLQFAGLPESTICYLKRFYVYHAGGLVKTAYKTGDIVRLQKFQNAIRKYLAVYEATSEGHDEWNQRMNDLLTDPGSVVAREG